MLVSAIIPAYNRKETICRAVDSVFAQTYPSIEVIVVDDGSIDGTAEQLAKYGSAVHVIRQKNSGPSAARNAGIRASRGEIIAFLDSDDYWVPNKIERQARLLGKAMLFGVDCCICNAQMNYAGGFSTTSFRIAELGSPISEGLWHNPTEVLLTRFLFFNQAVAVTRKCLNQVGLFNENYRLLEDYDLALRLSVARRWAFIQDPLVVWHGGATNSLSGNAKRIEVAERALQIISSAKPELAKSTEFGTRYSRLLRDQEGLLRRQIRAAKLSENTGIMGRVVSSLINTRVRIEKRLRRLSASYPRMETGGIDMGTPSSGKRSQQA